MSIKLISAAWDLDIGSTEKMVLMCLCDFASDEGGNCWPSVATIARKCSKSERTVQAALRTLEAEGYLATVSRAGTSNKFQLNPRKICTPAKSAPPQKTSDTPAKSAPKPLGTVNGLSNDKPMRAKGWPEIPEWMPPVQWNAFLQMRKKRGKWPTDHAVGLMVGKLERWRANGHDPGAILDNSTENEWTGLFEPRVPANDRQRSQHQRETTRQTGERVAARFAAAGGGAANLLPGPGAACGNDRE